MKRLLAFLAILPILVGCGYDHHADELQKLEIKNEHLRYLERLYSVHRGISEQAQIRVIDSLIKIEESELLKTNK